MFNNLDNIINHNKNIIHHIILNLTNYAKTFFTLEQCIKSNSIFNIDIIIILKLYLESFALKKLI